MDPLLNLISSIGTPAGIILVWWLLSRDIKALQDAMGIKLLSLQEDVTELKNTHKTCRAQTDQMIGECHHRITTIVKDVSFLEGRLNGKGA